MADLCDSCGALVCNHSSLTITLLLLVKREVLDDGIITLECIIDCEQRAEYNKSIAILIIII